MRYHLLSFQNYRAYRREWSDVNKMALFDHREFVIFSHITNEEKVVDSYRPRSRFESFFAYFFCGEKSMSVVQGVRIIKKLKPKIKSYLQLQ